MKKNQVRNRVEAILINNPKARDSDKELIACFAEQMGNTLLADAIRRSGMPSFESITRSRRIVQARNEELRPTEAMEQIRAEEEREWLEIVRKENASRMG